MDRIVTKNCKNCGFFIMVENTKEPELARYWAGYCGEISNNAIFTPTIKSPENTKCGKFFADITR